MLVVLNEAFQLGHVRVHSFALSTGIPVVREYMHFQVFLTEPFLTHMAYFHCCFGFLSFFDWHC